jgi:hypothetical protein
MSTTTFLELKKLSVFRFANTFVGKDPMDILLAGHSDPTVHGSPQHQKVVNVLGWTHPMPRGTLKGLGPASGRVQPHSSNAYRICITAE